MRIEYSGTQLEQVLELNKSRPIDFVYLGPAEFDSTVKEAEQKNILHECSRYWFTIKGCSIVFYNDPDAYTGD